MVKKVKYQNPLQVILLVISLLLFSMFTGCMNGPQPAPSTETEKAPHKTPEQEVYSKPKQALNNEKPEEPENATDELEISSTGNKVDASDTSNSKEEVEAEDAAWSAQHASLMGISVGTFQASVTARNGSPEEEYMMGLDGEEKLLVWVYHGFSIGFKANQTVEFVEVSSREVDPELGGLRIGDTSQDVITLLGEPDSNTEFVMTYVTDQSILKLDMDPETKQIQSIKLFPLS